MHFRAYLPLLLQLVAASHPLDSPGWLPGLTAFAVVSFSLTYNTSCRPYRSRTYISFVHFIKPNEQNLCGEASSELIGQNVDLLVINSFR